ncbi:hypothetical protein F5144DRAFT_5633 [Chaetomium tenue]|uniref:Uncharacterized protein n=1 Tax=Chaetomium tenue TaxID=1854479 RepID=A0ACB7PK09_9PEZI|nr:hypothetical protein F5144DRAFT_5633 [Chaetomium globosum]
MSDLPITHDQAGTEDGFEWEDAKSQNGVAFRIGRPTASQSQANPSAADSANPQEDPLPVEAQSVSVPVYWPTTPHQQWSEIQGDVRVGGLTDYALWPGGRLWWKWRLEVQNVSTRKYYFTDEDGDVYSLECINWGIHKLDYNSSKPNIVKVHWES